MTDRDLSGPIDSHCHLQSLPPDDREQALDDARERGVKGFLIPAIRLAEAGTSRATAHLPPVMLFIARFVPRRNET